MSSKTTRDHDTIRNWAEARGGRPSRVEGDLDGGLLRLDFGDPEEPLEEIGWDEFFAIFDDRELEFIYEDHLASGEESRVNRFIRTD